ncbi:LOW QUALITY PROTEIN: basic proline-rich protein [Drosophila eugracilis]|uniref:LOW QUALITY PROTEIN: basic proline-rich protein n=1 Tax=Drosophila eugracilis TaxID=29029 RepID=UPI001BDAC4B4|nr:LOW QUALITY PROTEIN: basic proline-rich protein [Drosophila eugracilis]
MDSQTQALKLLFLWTSLATGILVPTGAIRDVPVGSQVSGELLHRSKRTMTTICVEIRPSGPQDEPYYMCRGANFGGENPQQSCVEVRNQGGQGEPFYMCRGAESAGLGLGPEGVPSVEQSRPVNDHSVVQHDSVNNFPWYPALEGGSYPQQSVTGDPVHQAQPTGPSTYQKFQREPLPQQHQAQAQYGFNGSPIAAPAPALPAQSYGLPELSHPIIGSPPTASPGASAGPGPATTPASFDPASPARSSNRPSENGIAENSRHQFRFPEDVLSVPDVGFKWDEPNQRYLRPGGVGNQARPQDEFMRVPLSHSQEPENDPVMKAFYSSLADTGYATHEASAPAGNKEVPGEPRVGKMTPGYSSYSSQYPEAPAPPSLPPPPPMYSHPEASPSPNPYYTGCSAPPPPFPCSAPQDNGVSYSSSCPSFQPVIIAMPCYGPRQPTPSFGLPRAPFGTMSRQPMATPFGLDPAPVAGPFGGAFGMGRPFGMTPQMGAQGYDMENQVGGPFGMGMQLGMGLNPFGPFGALNPFNPFNRILGASPTNAPTPNDNFFQRVFKLDDETTSSPETAPNSESHSEKPGKLNFSSSTPTPSSSEQPDSDVGDAQGSPEHEDSVEDIDKEDDQAVTTTTPASEVEASGDGHGIQVLVSKASELLMPDKRKRHNSRSKSPQKHRYLQQL